MPEGHQRRVDAVLQRRAMADQMQPVAGELALAADRRVGQPDRRHEVAPGQLGQHARVDLVGLASQRRQPLDLLRVGDQHLPAELFERVVHEPRAGHRLDHRPHRLPSQALGEMAQPVGVRRRGRLRRPARRPRRAGRRRAGVDSDPIQRATYERASSCSLLDDTPSLPPRRPSFIAVRSGSAALGGLRGSAHGPASHRVLGRACPVPRRDGVAQSRQRRVCARRRTHARACGVRGDANVAGWRDLTAYVREE